MQYRTSRINEAVRLIYSINNELGTIKKRKGNAVSHLSGRVDPTGESSNFLVEDLKSIIEIDSFLQADQK